jgi:hypothetical protein
MDCVNMTHITDSRAEGTTQALEFEMERVGETDDGWLYTPSGSYGKATPEGYEGSVEDPIVVLELRKSAVIEAPARIHVVIEIQADSPDQGDQGESGSRGNPGGQVPP